jgi:hypothetical protein
MTTGALTQCADHQRCLPSRQRMSILQDRSQSSPGRHEPFPRSFLHPIHFFTYWARPGKEPPSYLPRLAFPPHTEECVVREYAPGPQSADFGGIFEMSNDSVGMRFLGVGVAS